MDSTLNLSQFSGNTKSSFWKTKEGKWGIVVAAILTGIGVYGLGLILPFLISLAQNVLTFGLLLLAIGVLIFMILDKDIRTFAWYAFRAFTRFLRTALIQTDPVGIIENYLSHLRKQFEKLVEKLRELSGARQKLKDAIKRETEELNKQMELATAAQRNKLSPQEIAVYTNQAGRLTAMIERYKVMLSKLETLHNVLADIQKACKVIIADKENQIKTIKTERETMNIGFSAWSSAMSVLRGDPDKRFYFDQAMEAIQNDISMKSGIIEQYINESSEIMQAIDLQNSVFEEKGMKLLEKWQKDGVTALLPESNTLQSLPAEVQYEVVSTTNSTTNKKSDNRYSKILKK